MPAVVAQRDHEMMEVVLEVADDDAGLDGHDHDPAAVDVAVEIEHRRGG